MLVSETMPDHVHALARPGAEEAFRRMLIGFTVRFGVRFDVLPPEPANSPAIAMRQARYILFNGVRGGHVNDPFELPWSTLRDLVGATWPIWTPAPMLARVLRIPPSRLVPALLNLADYRIEIPRREPVTVASLDALRAAAASTLRIPYRDTLTHTESRRLIIQAHYEIATPTATHLARELGCSTRTVHRSRAPRSPALDAFLLCLGDPRLRRHGCGQ